MRTYGQVGSVALGQQTSAVLETTRILERVGHDPLVANYASFMCWDRNKAVTLVTNSSIPPCAAGTKRNCCARCCANHSHPPLVKSRACHHAV